MQRFYGQNICAKTLMRNIFVLLSTVLWTSIVAQYRINIDIHARVDTNNSEVQNILNLYRNYLLARPDSSQASNPHWCAEDKVKYKDFDFTRRFIYDQFPMEYLSQMYRFVILSIEKEYDAYAIRTALIAQDISQPYMRKQNPWAITRIYAIKENKSWKLTNAFSFKIKNWKTLQEGNIIYHFPSGISLNPAEFQKSTSFCDSVASLLQVKSWKPFDYYVTSSSDKLSELLGFDFALVAATKGMAFSDEILLNGTGSAFYPHEFVHHVAEEKNIKHELISEGLATWLGGSRLETFTQNLTQLSKAVKGNDTVNVDHVIDKKWGWTVGAFYTTGAIFCRLVFEKQGLEGLNKLFTVPANDNSNLREKLKKLLQTSDLDQLWKKELRKYE
jgi:hypothetical protein